ncbi:MAG: hypothetical protein QXS38_00165 [Candidatus Pacearchaeota archaeon]
MNNRGQIGKLITLFPMIFLVFVIMAIFVVLSAAFSIGKSSESPVFMEKVVVQDNLMLKTIDVTTYEPERDGRIVPKALPEMSVMDSIVMYWSAEDAAKRDKLKRESVGIALRNLLNEQENCLFIYSGSMENPSQRIRFNPDFLIYRTESGRIIHAEENPNSVETVLNTVYRNILNRARSISFMKGSEKVYVDYYYGGCE